jgi:predicted CxxxxCH...CXXCH cytochrome family protein
MRAIRLERLGLLPVLAGILAAGCGSGRTINEALQTTCTDCHGGQDNKTGAPPRGIDGSATGPGVGAHTTHVEAGVACSSCHVVPVAGEPGHPAGRSRAVVTFGGLALAGGATPHYDPATYTCSTVYCHGGTLDAGGSATAPTWGEHLPTCGTCHGFAPPSHASYPARFDCHSCHAASVESDNATLKPAHLNGTLNFN